MTASQFLAWWDASGLRFAADVSRATGLHRNTVTRWRRMAEAGEDVPATLAHRLAMAAVVAGLDPWPGADG